MSDLIKEIDAVIATRDPDLLIKLVENLYERLSHAETEVEWYKYQQKQQDYPEEPIYVQGD